MESPTPREKLMGRRYNNADPWLLPSIREITGRAMTMDTKGSSPRPSPFYEILPSRILRYPTG